MNECMGPGCANVIDTDEPFCSQQCRREFDAYAADMEAWLALDHETSWRELEAS